MTRSRDQLTNDIKTDLDNNENLNTPEMTLFLLSKILRELKQIKRNTSRIP